MKSFDITYNTGFKRTFVLELSSKNVMCKSYNVVMSLNLSSMVFLIFAVKRSVIIMDAYSITENCIQKKGNTKEVEISTNNISKVIHTGIKSKWKRLVIRDEHIRTC